MPLTNRDLDVERRLSSLEATVRELKERHDFLVQRLLRFGAGVVLAAVTGLIYYFRNILT